MPKIKHITTGDIIPVAKNPMFVDGIWECGDQRFTDPAGTEYEAVADIQAVIKFDYLPAYAKTTDITINVRVVNPIDDTPLPVTETYYVPLFNSTNGQPYMDQMLTAIIVDGVGQIPFKVSTPGIYSIKPDMIRPRPTALFSEMPDIAIF